MVLAHVESRNWKRPDAELDGLWIVGDPVPPVSQSITRHAVPTSPAGKCAAMSCSHPAHPPAGLASVTGEGGGGGGTGRGGGGGRVVVLGG